MAAVTGGERPPGPKGKEAVVPAPPPSPAGPLTYGMQLPVQSQSALYAEPWEASATPADLVRVAGAADRAGFAYIAGCDHIAIPRRLAEGMSTVWYDPVATLSFLAGVTERVLLMSHVAVVGLRHPLVTAKQYATLDHLSGGRLILGAGHVREEFEAVGADFDGRGGVLDETIDALRAALGPEEYPEFAGSGSPSPGSGSCRAPPRSGSRSGWAAPRPPPCAGPPYGGRLAPAGRSPGPAARADRPAARSAGGGGGRGADRDRCDHRAAVRR